MGEYYVQIQQGTKEIEGIIGFVYYNPLQTENKEVLSVEEASGYGLRYLVPKKHLSPITKEEFDRFQKIMIEDCLKNEAWKYGEHLASTYKENKQEKAR